MILGKASGVCRGTLLSFLMIPLSGLILAQVEPDRSGIGQAEFRHPGLTIRNASRQPGELPQQAAARAVTDLAALGVSANMGRLDVRGGRWATLILTEPLVPGSGVGNSLGWSSLGRPAPASRGDLGKAAAQAFREYLQANGQALRIDSSELVQPGKTTVLRDGALVQIHLPRQHNGIRVRDSYLHAVINHGNLVLMGANKWGDINVSTVPDVSQDDALATVQTQVEPYSITDFWGKSGLIIVPLAEGPDVNQIPVGLGYTHRRPQNTHPDRATRGGLPRPASSPERNQGFRPATGAAFLR